MAADNEKERSFKKIGEYLECDSSEIERVTDIQREMETSGRKGLLGELLVTEKLITHEALNEAVLQQRLDRLQQSDIFSGLELDELMKIRRWVSEATVEKGAEFIVQDSVGSCFYVLIDGLAQVYRYGDYGEKIILDSVEPGDTIGEMGYFSNGRRLASISAEEKCQLLMIKYQDMEMIFEESPTLTRNFLNLITDRLRRSNIRFQKTVSKSLRTETCLENIYHLLDMTEVLKLRIGIESQIERIIITASQLMNTERATLFLLDDFTGELWSMIAEGVKSRKLRVQMGQGVAGWVAENDEIVNIPNAYEDSRFDSSMDETLGFKTRNILCGPLKNFQGKMVGVIQLINKKDGKKEGVFDENDKAMFKAFSYQTAIAVENLQLYQKLLDDHEKMAIVFDVSTSVAHTLDLDTLFIKIVDKISEALNVERSSLFLLDNETDELWSKVAQQSEITEIRFPKTEGLAGHVAKTGHTLIIDDAYKDPRFFPEVDAKTGFHTKTVLCAPIINRQGDIIGATEAINKKDGAFDKDDEDLLMSLSSQIAVALENAQLYGNTVDMKNYLSSVQDSISNSILTLDNNHHVVTANKAAGILFQKQPEELIKKDFRKIIDARNDHMKSLVENVYASQTAVVDSDVELILLSGKQHFTNVNFVPLIDYSGEHNGQVLVFEDITTKKRMKTTLTRYMAKDIAERLIDEPSRQTLGGTQSRATIIFSDIRGYTGITESLTAEQTVAFLNEYFSLMVNVIFKNQGVLDKFIGDGIMSVFGVPYEKEDDAVRAVRTAIQMRDELAEFNLKKKAASAIPIQIGIGICTGDVISGNIGSERRMDYTVIGDEVNTASRVETLTKYYGTDILISDSTRIALGDNFVTRLVDSILIRGKKQSIDIHEVLGEKGIELTASQELFCRGLERYRKFQFDEAARFFEEGKGEDPLCNVFFLRCRKFKETPPPDNWDGVWVVSESKESYGVRSNRIS
jgi:adenylate cyclase